MREAGVRAGGAEPPNTAGRSNPCAVSGAPRRFRGMSARPSDPSSSTQARGVRDPLAPATGNRIDGRDHPGKVCFRSLSPRAYARCAQGYRALIPPQVPARTGVSQPLVSVEVRVPVCSKREQKVPSGSQAAPVYV